MPSGFGDLIINGPSVAHHDKYAVRSFHFVSPTTKSVPNFTLTAFSSSSVCINTPANFRDLTTSPPLRAIHANGHVFSGQKYSPIRREIVDRFTEIKEMIDSTERGEHTDGIKLHLPGQEKQTTRALMEIPMDKAVPAIEEKEVVKLAEEFSEDLISRLEEFNKKTGGTPFREPREMKDAFKVTFSRYVQSHYAIVP